ncbi:hypothetical protein MTR67_044074 [Solanum verrucosum]|uniref:Non-haem dioxygenase N-terminal domain-containing protein n=1 Tax=Solanum verrucosum TaxID=315347 RepID=A0AAF0ZVQ8_SOLVR|nr:hypothetical protein MTR67_044074 [Solanum verrucosum]
MKVSPMKGVMRFGKKGKLSYQYIGPYRIYKRIGNVAYELELPQELAAIFDSQVRKLRTKELASIKVIWRNQFDEKATSEAEEDMKKRYPDLFEPREIPDHAQELHVPLIDSRVFFSGDPFAAQQASRFFGEACRSHGFFLIVNYGVDANRISNAHRYMDMFFDMPLCEKKKAQRKIGEHYVYARTFAGRFSSKLPWKETLFTILCSRRLISHS